MEYELQSDVVMVTVCGEQLLIAAGEARGKVPYVKGINTAGAYFWKLLEQKLSKQEIIVKTAEDYDIPAEKAQEAFERFCDVLRQNGYLLGKN